MSELTYPCIIGHRILELTAAQRDLLQERNLSLEERVERIEEFLKIGKYSELPNK